ncbi:MAG: SDR family NAD(P)-dependent oxidoreductase [Pseudomonadales bacterium]
MAISDLSGKIVFITGAASGIGAATALAFAKAGCEIVAADLSIASLQQTAAAVEKTGAAFHAIELDVTDEGAWSAIAANIASGIGVPDILINNAGVGAHGSFLNVPIKAVRKVMDVNLYGVIYGCHAFLPAMLAADGERHLVNIASLASVNPMPNMSAYAASKYAVDGLTEVLAMELEDTNISVTCVHPGVINTPIVEGDSHNGPAAADGLKRLGEYYREHGSDPAVVANGIVNAVRKDTAHLYVGAKAPFTAVLKRLSPGLTRRLSTRTATQIGYA